MSIRLRDRAEHWEDFLTRWKRAINLMLADAGDDPARAEAAAWIREGLRNDPLILYANEARNADEHDAEGHAERRPGGWAMGAPGESFAILNGVVTPEGFQGEVIGNPTVVRFADRLELRPVRTRGGNLVQPPTQDLDDLAAAATAFAEEALRRLREA